jgi:hypothetical protein
MDENARILCGGMEYFELKLHKKISCAVISSFGMWYDHAVKSRSL